MSGLVSSVYDIAKGSVFCKRNATKFENGDIVRGGVAVGQLRNATKETVHQSQRFSKGFKGEGFLGEKIAKASEKINNLNKKIANVSRRKSVLGYTTKAINVASKYINPLICVSGGVQVALADDKTSEAVKQTCALGSMFTSEAIARSFLTEKGRRKLAGKAIGQNKVAKTLMHWARKVDRLPFRKGMPGIAKFAVPVATALGFIGMSIGGYAVGAKLGNTLNDARKSYKPQLITKVQPQPAKNVDYSA